MKKILTEKSYGYITISAVESFRGNEAFRQRIENEKRRSVMTNTMIATAATDPKKPGDGGKPRPRCGNTKPGGGKKPHDRPRPVGA